MHLVSVIIPTLNSEKIIEECLTSIKEQTYQNIEIIIIDSHSKDRTVDIARSYGATVFNYGVEQSVAFGRVFAVPFQRNYGVEQAKGKYVYYVDSDMRLMPNVVEECVKKIEQDGADAVIVPEFSYGEGFWAKCRVLEKACYYNDSLVDAARFVKKEVWEKLGGLDTSLGGGDDWDFQLRLNKAEFKTLNSISYIRHYEGRLSLKRQLKKKFVYGKTVKEYLMKHRKHPVMLFKQYSLLRPAYFRNWKLILRDPIHGLGMLFMKTLEYIFAFIGIISTVLHPEKINLKRKNSKQRSYKM